MTVPISDDSVRYPLGDDIGLVRLRDVMGSDLSVVNAARVSFDKKAEWEEFFPDESESTAGPSYRLSRRDRRLLAFLARYQHKLPFAHATVSLEIYCPLIIARQWYKHRIGAVYVEEGELIEISHADIGADGFESHNESSRRYITENNQYYQPAEWRSAPDNKKQGSGAPIGRRKARVLSRELDAFIASGDRLYERALEMGVAPEQARLFLPYASLYVRFIWTCSLLRILEYLVLRDADDAQWEIAQYAKAVRELVEPHFPESFAAWFDT